MVYGPDSMVHFVLSKGWLLRAPSGHLELDADVPMTAAKKTTRA